MILTLQLHSRVDVLCSAVGLQLAHEVQVDGVRRPHFMQDQRQLSACVVAMEMLDYTSRMCGYVFMCVHRAQRPLVEGPFHVFDGQLVKGRNHVTVEGDTLSACCGDGGIGLQSDHLCTEDIRTTDSRR